MTLAQARARVAELNTEANAGRDPRAVKLEKSQADAEALKAEQLQRDRQKVTVGDAWAAYVDERSVAMVRRKGKVKPAWSDHHKQDVCKLTQPGGEPRKRGKGKTKTGPLFPLLALPLATIEDEVLLKWANREVAKRPTQAALAYRHFSTFLRWCSASKEWRELLGPDALSLNKTRAILGGSANTKEHDCLEESDLAPWFEALQRYPNPVVKAYLAVALLIGARRGEVATLRWDAIDFRRKRMEIRDKVNGTRFVPLSPYLESWICSLPRTGEYVFASSSASGHLEAPTRALANICAEAGVKVSIHGLRRSFETLAEAAELPQGAINQIAGRAPGSVSERHYKRRSLQMLLELMRDRWEAWLLTTAGIEFTPAADGLRLVK
jgi:integrase